MDTIAKMNAEQTQRSDAVLRDRKALNMLILSYDTVDFSVGFKQANRIFIKGGFGNMAVLAPNMIGNFWPCFDEHERSNFDGMIKEFDGIAQMYSSQTIKPAFSIHPLSENEYHHAQEYAPFFKMLNKEFETTLQDFVFPSADENEYSQSIYVQFTENGIEKITL